jgi:FkbM family methyltransferase
MTIIYQEIKYCGLLDKVELSRKRFPNALIVHAVVSDKEEEVTFYRANNGQSSSILELGLHTTLHPHVCYTDSYQTQAVPLKDVICKYDIDYNFINLDIQGMELKALKGMEEYLHTIDYIYTEVNCDYVYKDCALISEMDDYLLSLGFKRVETSWSEAEKWGDAFYVRSIFVQ